MYVSDVTIVIFAPIIHKQFEHISVAADSVSEEK